MLGRHGRSCGTCAQTRSGTHTGTRHYQRCDTKPLPTPLLLRYMPTNQSESTNHRVQTHLSPMDQPPYEELRWSPCFGSRPAAAAVTWPTSSTRRARPAHPRASWSRTVSLQAQAGRWSTGGHNNQGIRFLCRVATHLLILLPPPFHSLPPCLLAPPSHQGNVIAQIQSLLLRGRPVTGYTNNINMVGSSPSLTHHTARIT